MKIGVIGGAGLVGSTTAFCLGLKGIADEIVLVDVKENMLLAHAWDMEQAIMDVSPTKITGGDSAALAGCDIVIHAASVNESNTASRDESLALNYKILQAAAASIEQHCPEATIVMAANPVDVLNYGLYKLLKGDRKKYVGFSRNDTLRLKWAIAKRENVAYDDVQALSVGEHGFMTVPLFSDISIGGVKKNYDAAEQKEISEMIIEYFTRYQALKSGRSSGWTSAVSLAYVCERIISEDGIAVPCSVVLDGEYGLDGLSLSVPVKLCRQGVSEILNAKMDSGEREKFLAAAKKTQDHIQSLGF